MRDWAEELVAFYEGMPAPSRNFLSDDTDELEAVQVDEPAAPAVAKPAIKVPKTSPIALGMGALVLVGVLAGGGLVVKGVVDSQSAPVQPTSVAQDCADEPMADLVTPEGVVVAFQHGYFSGDVDKLTATLADDSPLVAEDFSTVVPEKPMDVCVTILDSSSSRVFARTRVDDSDNSRIVVYEQVFDIIHEGSGPRIATISDEKKGES